MVRHSLMAVCTTVVRRVYGAKKQLLRRRPHLMVLLVVIVLLSVFAFPFVLKKLQDGYSQLHGNLACFTADGVKALVRYMIHANDVTMDKYNITHWIDCGTLLGAVRYKDVIPWDHDGDMAYLLADLSAVKSKVVPELRRLYDIFMDSDNPVQMRRKGVSVDVFQYATYQDLKIEPPDGTPSKMLTRAKYRLAPWLESYFDADAAWLFPVHKCRLGDVNVSCPAQSVRILKQRYAHSYSFTIPFKLRCWSPWNLAYIISGHAREDLVMETA